MTTGAWRIPRSSSSNRTSPPSLPGDTENAGFVITPATGALSGTPAATIRVRMSRSVTIPKPPPRRSTIAAFAPAAVICRATSRMLVIGSHLIVGARNRVATGWCAGS